MVDPEPARGTRERFGLLQRCEESEILKIE
jgi:hypothetical protein